MITKPQLQRLIITRLNCMVIDDERELPEDIGGGYALRQPCNLLEWVLPTERFGFGGTGTSWEDVRNELIDGIWNRLNGLPVTKQKVHTCKFCNRKYTTPYRSVNFCNRVCSEAFYATTGTARRRLKVMEVFVDSFN